MMTRWGIRSKLLVMALMPPLLIALFLGLYLVQTRMESLQDAVTQRGITMANQLAHASEHALSTFQYQWLQELADMIVREADVVSITIRDHRGRQLAHAQREDSSRLTLQEQALLRLMRIFNRQGLELSFRSPIQRSRINNHVWSPPTLSAVDTPSDLGFVKVDLSLRATSRIQASALRDSLIIIIGIVIASALVGHYASRSVTVPILKLTEAIQELEKGHLTTRIPETFGGEIGTLQHGFNTMASALQQAHDELQDKVEHATCELRETLEAVEIQNLELDEARKKALEASQVKSEFLANMSHEIRTPINGILGFTDLLGHTRLSAEQKDYVNTIKDSGANLLAIINDILDFSKIEAGKLVIDSVAFDLRDSVEEVLSLLAPAAFGKNLELVHLIYRDVPFRLYGDPIRIRQVLTNMVHNAIKFTPVGRVIVRVMLDEENDKEVLLRITVSDTGIGLSETNQKKLFNAFSQADTSTTRRFGGAGLGLVISKKLVEQRGGTVGLESAPDKGSTFWFTLRLIKQKTAEQAASGKETALNGKRVLLLDEMPLSRLALRHMFEAWEMEVIETDNKQSFLSSLSNREKWDLAVLGLSRAEITSQSLNQIFNRVKKFNVPLVALPNTVDRAELRALYDMGACVSLPKTTRRQTILREIHRAITAPLEESEFYPHEADSSVVFKPVAAAPASRNPLRVLVVDDNRINRKLATTLAIKQGAAVTEVENGLEAVRKCEAEWFDVVLMDIHMPVMGGEEATQRIRELYSGKRQPGIIALTANAQPEERDKLINSGMDDCLVKPITDDRLATILKKYAHLNEGSEFFPAVENGVTSSATNSSVGAPTSKIATPDSGASTAPSATSHEATTAMSGETSGATATSPTFTATAASESASAADSLSDELFAMLLAELPTHAEQIRLHFEDGNFPSLQESVHKLNGAASVCQMGSLRERADQLETALRHKSMGSIPDTYEALIAEIDRLLGQSSQS